MASKLFQPDSIYVVPARHVGKNDLIAFIQSAENFYCIHRTASQLDGDARRALAVGIQLEHAYSAVFLAKRWTSDELDVGEPVEVDSSIDAQIGPFPWCVAIQLYIDGDCAVDNRWVNAHDCSVDQSIVRIDRCRLAKGNVLRLRLSDLQLRLQMGRIDYLGNVRACGDTLPFDNRNLGQHAVDARSHVQSVKLFLLELVQRL